MTDEQRNFYRTNMLEVLKMLDSVPEKNLDLCTYGPESRSQLTCGSVACVGGWMPFWPHFASIGVTRGEDGTPTYKRRNKGGPLVSELLFGNRSLLKSRALSDFDDWPCRGTDKESATRRFRNALKALDAS